MTARFWVLLLVFFALCALCAVPLGRFMKRVFAGENTLTARALGPVERVVYRLASVDPSRETDWKLPRTRTRMIDAWSPDPGDTGATTDTPRSASNSRISVGASGNDWASLSRWVWNNTNSVVTNTCLGIWFSGPTPGSAFVVTTTRQYLPLA